MRRKQIRIGWRAAGIPPASIDHDILKGIENSNRVFDEVVEHDAAAANRIRLTAQLLDAARGSHLWAERYDREPSDLFSVQDEIVRTLVAAIEPELDEAAGEGANQAPRQAGPDTGAADPDDTVRGFAAPGSSTS